MKSKMLLTLTLVLAMEMMCTFAYAQSYHERQIDKIEAELGLERLVLEQFEDESYDDFYKRVHEKYGDYTNVLAPFYNFSNNLALCNLDIDIDTIYDTYIMSVSISHIDLGHEGDSSIVNDAFSHILTCPIPKTIPDYAFFDIFSDPLELESPRAFSQPVGNFIYSLSEEVSDLLSLEQWRSALKKRKEALSNMKTYKNIRIPIDMRLYQYRFYYFDYAYCDIMQNDNDILSLRYSNACCGDFFAEWYKYVTYKLGAKKKIETEQDWADLLNIDVVDFETIVNKAIKEYEDNQEKHGYFCGDNTPTFFVKGNWLCADFCVDSKFHVPRIALFPLTQDAKQRKPYVDGVEQD
jgi:hypothetical protein